MRARSSSAVRSGGSSNAVLGEVFARFRVRVRVVFWGVVRSKGSSWEVCSRVAVRLRGRESDREM